MKIGRLSIFPPSRPDLSKAASWAEHLAAIFGTSRILAFAARRRSERRARAGAGVGDEASTGAGPDAPACERDEALAQGDRGLFDRIPAAKRWELDREKPGARIKRWFLGRDRVPIPSYIGLIEDPPRKGADPKTGICCSGGGIRSAAFNLGALQKLQDGGRLQKAKYLAAVSGGSYIAAAFCMVAKTPKGDLEESDDSDRELFEDGRRPPFYHGSPEEQYLRNRSSYMAPGGVGRIRLILRVALGLLVNLAFLGAALVVIAWLLALYYRAVHEGLQGPLKTQSADIQDLEWQFAAAVAGLALALGVVSLFFRSTHDRGQRALETLAIYGLGLALLIVVVAVVLPELISSLRGEPVGDTANDVGGSDARGDVGVAAGGGFGALLVAVLLELRSKLTFKEAKDTLAWYQKLAAPLQKAIAQFAAWLVGPLLLGSILVFALLAFVASEHINFWVIAGVIAVLAWFWFSSDVTSWSLHPFYRRRLCTAFALKRVKAPGGGDFGMAVERDYRTLVPLSESGVEPGAGLKTWPTLVVCAAANVSDPGATPPGRSVTSFTFSPIAMGGPLVGGVCTVDFEDYIAEERARDFTLPAAVAMSGAAVSPSMGKETRRSIRFLLGLANVRLGVWVPNPRREKRWLETSLGLRTQAAKLHDHGRGRVTKRLGEPASKTAQQRRRWLSAPRAGPWYLLKEMCGWNSVNDPYLYVTDGGHYENLGLVELLRRGCTEVFCFDASGGRSLDALGDAIALARSELNVEIEIDVKDLEEDKEKRLAKSCCARGKIRYPKGPDGVLIYARTVVTEHAPYDVQAFRLRDKAFPHHSTLDQLYTDEKFEAYRELGATAGAAAIKEAAAAARAASKAATARQPRRSRGPKATAGISSR